MAQNNPKDAWRANAGPSASAARGPAGKNSGGAKRWVAAAFVVAALAGAIAGLFVYLKPDPEPVVLVLPITQYKHPAWPANPLADADARGLFEAFPGRTAPAFPIQEKARILEAIRQVVDESRGPASGRPILVYLNALGIARGDTPYLLPGDADPDDDSTWLPLDEILAALENTKVPRSLILDLRSVSSQRCASATDDLNECIRAKLQARPQPDGKLWILAANNPENGPVLLRPIRRSAFGLALAQAIGGRADGWNADKSSNEKVSFQEFAKYAQQATFVGTKAYGSGEQLPALFGPGGDFPLVSVIRGQTKPMPEAIDAEPYPDWLKQSWVDRDKWVSDGLHRRAPRILEHQGLAASRAEEAWSAGIDPAAIRDRHEPTLKKLAGAGSAFPTLQLPRRSHARWSASPGSPAFEAAAAATLRPYLAKIASDEPMKKEDAAMSLSIVRGLLDAKPDISPEAIQGAVLNEVWNLKTPTHEQIGRAAALLMTVPSANRFSETTVAIWVAGLPAEQVREWEKAEAGAMLSVLRSMKSAEQASALDGRTWPWLRNELDRLDAIRRAALVLLGDPDSGPAQFLAAKSKLDSARLDFDKVRDAAARLNVCFGEIEEGRAVLADLAAVYPHKLAPSPAVVASQWAGLVEQYSKIRSSAQPPKSTGLPKLDDLSQAAQTFDVLRTSLMALRIGADDTDPQRLELALRWPWLRGTERDALRTRLEEAMRAATKRALDRWPTTPPEEATSTASPSKTREDAMRDSKIAGDLLALVGSKNRRELAAQYKAAEPGQRAEIGWAIHPDDFPAVPLDAAGANPEPAERRRAEIDAARWIGTRYALDAAELRAVKDKACRAAADDLDALAGVYRNWNP